MLNQSGQQTENPYTWGMMPRACQVLTHSLSTNSEHAARECESNYGYRQPLAQNFDVFLKLAMLKMALNIREMNNLVYPILILCTVLAFYQLITNIKISLRWSVSAHMLKDARDADDNYNCYFSNIQDDEHTSSFIVLVMWVLSGQAPL